MPQQRLDRADVVPEFWQVRRETVTQRMACHALGQPHVFCRTLDRRLNCGFEDVPTPGLAGIGVVRELVGREEIRPRQRPSRPRGLSLKRVGKLYPSLTLRAIRLVQIGPPGDLSLKSRDQRRGHQCHAVLRPFASADRHLQSLKINIFDFHGTCFAHISPPPYIACEMSRYGGRIWPGANRSRPASAPVGTFRDRLARVAWKSSKSISSTCLYKNTTAFSAWFCVAAATRRSTAR